MFISNATIILENQIIDGYIENATSKVKQEVIEQLKKTNDSYINWPIIPLTAHSHLIVFNDDLRE